MVGLSDSSSSHFMSDMRSHGTVVLLNDHPLQWPSLFYDMWRTVFSVCAVPDRRSSLKRDQWPGQMGFSSSRMTTPSTVYFQESRVELQHSFPMVEYYNFALKTPLKWTVFYFGDATTLWMDGCCIVSRRLLTMLPAHRHSDTFVVFQVFWTSRVRGSDIINGNATLCFMYRPWHWTVATTGPGGQWIRKSTGPPKNPLAPQKHVMTKMFSRQEFMISRVKLHTFVH